MNAPFRRPDILVDVPDLGEMTLTLHYDVSAGPYARESHPDGPSRGIGTEWMPRLKGGLLCYEADAGKAPAPGLRLDAAEIERILPRHRLDELDEDAVEQVRAHGWLE